MALIALGVKVATKEPCVGEINAKVLKVCHYIESCDYIPILDELSQQVNLSPFHLQREFKKVLGITPRNYADALRQLRFKKALKTGGVGGYRWGPERKTKLLVMEKHKGSVSF